MSTVTKGASQNIVEGECLHKWNTTLCGSDGLTPKYPPAFVSHLLITNLINATFMYTKQHSPLAIPQRLLLTG